jgi:hypothetical protein
MIWKKGKYLKTSTMVTVIFMQSVMENAQNTDGIIVDVMSGKHWCHQCRCHVWKNTDIRNVDVLSEKNDQSH